MIIDVSKWQGNINWKTVKEKHPDIEGVYIKASEGIGFTDPNMRNNAVEAIKAGFKIGFYHFASLNAVDVVNDAKSEAKYFLTQTKNMSASMPYVLDIESNASKLSKDKVLLWVKSFLKEIDLAGEDCWLYSYTPFLNDNLPVNHDLGTVSLWLAAYSDSYKVPIGWIKPELWQYTQKGKMEGIIGNVDLNKRV
jgi:lysozyme